MNYSKKYETLKQKGKNRSKKEEKYFQVLEKGKQFFENRATDPSVNEPFDLFSKKFWSERIAAQRYLEKTNYGERVEGIAELLSWPIALIVDMGSMRPEFDAELKNEMKKEGRLK